MRTGEIGDNKMDAQTEAAEADSVQRRGSTATPEFNLTPKEELAVIAERLKKHVEDSKDLKCKLRLDFASDLIRHAMIWR